MGQQDMAADGRTRIQPVILSGGAGTRLWPLSRPDRPKQFLKLTDDLTMLQATVKRVLGEPDFLAPMIVANESHEAQIRAQLIEIGALDASLILEPLGRNTAPAIALAAISTPGDAPLLIMPSDHVIEDVDGFRDAVREAVPLAAQSYLLTFGIKPDAPETGYGYLERGSALGGNAWSVKSFVEKPDESTAEIYFQSREHYWNGGIFLFRSQDYLAELSAHEPDMLGACRAAVEKGINSDGRIAPDKSAFARSPAISIDYAVMEKAAKVAMVPMNIGWSDIGSWDALRDYLASKPKSEGVSRTVEVDSEGCFLFSDGPVIAALGVQDLLVLATSGAVLVLRKGESQRVREVVDLLKSKGAGAA